jgi:hypothetical protein
MIEVAGALLILVIRSFDSSAEKQAHIARTLVAIRTGA